MKTRSVVWATMRLQKLPALCTAILAARSAFAADPVPTGKPDASPAFLTAPAKLPAKDADKTLPLGDPIPRPGMTPSLLPDEIPPPAKRPATARTPAGGKPATTLKPQATAEELDLRIRYRKARNIAETNETVRAAWEETRFPKSDQQKRDALRRYYDLLFAKMLSVDRGISPLVEDRRKAGAAALTQTRIAPTVPND